jgi:hypothetical protein
MTCLSRSTPASSRWKPLRINISINTPGGHLNQSQPDGQLSILTRRRNIPRNHHGTPRYQSARMIQNLFTEQVTGCAVSVEPRRGAPRTESRERRPSSERCGSYPFQDTPTGPCTLSKSLGQSISAQDAVETRRLSLAQFTARDAEFGVTLWKPN